MIYSDSTKSITGLILAGLLLVIISIDARAQSSSNERQLEKEQLNNLEQSGSALQRTTWIWDRAIAIIDVSDLEVRSTNFGSISTQGVGIIPTLLYPRPDGSAEDDFFWTNTIALGVEAGPWHPNDQVHESSGLYQNINRTDWEAMDGARGSQFSDPPQDYFGYPIMAISDQPETWPSTGWPAPEDIQESWLGSQTWYKWARRADQESYCEFDDAYAGRDGTGKSCSLGITVRKRILGYTTPDAVFIQHELTNNSSYTYTNVYVGQICDFGSPTRRSFRGFLRWDSDRNSLYAVGKYDPATDTHQDDDGNTVGWVSLLFLESPSGSMKSDEQGVMVDNPTEVLTRLALLDYRDRIRRPDEEGLYGALTASIGKMTGQDAEDIWKLSLNQGMPILKQTEYHQKEYYPNYISNMDNFIYASSGPFDLAPGESIDYVIAFAAGPTQEEMLATADEAILKYQHRFPGPGPQTLAEHIELISETISSLPLCAFRDENGNLRKALLNEMRAVGNMIEVENYRGAASKVENAILTRTDGFFDGNPHNDWIVTEGAQQLLYPIIQNFLGALSNEITAQEQGIGEGEISIEDLTGREPLLLQNYPNPFNPSTKIWFKLPEATRVELSIYSIRGVKIATLVNGRMQEGEHEITWIPNNLPSGIYIAELKAGLTRQVMKMTFVK